MEQRLVRTRDGEFCPARAALAMVGQRWVPRILYELIDGKRRFNDLVAMVGGCNSRTLRDRLKALEDSGIVERHLVATTTPSVEYELTPPGRELAEGLLPLCAWGRRYMTPQMLASVEG